MRTKEQQRAWREKMGLIWVILVLMAGVGFLTFGFTKAVCNTTTTRFYAGSIDTGSVVIHGYAYDFDKFNHPKVGSFDGTQNPLYVGKAIRAQLENEIPKDLPLERDFRVRPHILIPSPRHL